MAEKKQGNHAHKKISLMTVLAHCKTAESDRLLEEHNIPKAVNHEDLEYKLSKLYRDSDDKISLEKKVAELHPHKDFILKYCSPKKEEEPIKTESIKPKEVVDAVSMAEKIIVEPKSRFDSCSCSSCQKSSFDANPNSLLNQNQKSTDDKIVLLAIFGFVSVIALVLVTKK